MIDADYVPTDDSRFNNGHGAELGYCAHHDAECVGRWVGQGAGFVCRQGELYTSGITGLAVHRSV